MYVITGATGNTGREIAQALIAAGKKVKVIGRSADKLKMFTGQGAEAAVGSLDDAAFLTKTFTGATAVYAMIPPNLQAENMRAYQNKIADALVAAVKNANVKYVVTLSSLGAHLTEKAGVVQGLHDMEQKFNELNGVNVLHLRPTYFMENTLGSIGMIKNMGINGSPIKADLKFPIVAAKDIAQKAFERLSKLNFSGKSVQYILGPRDVTYGEITRILGMEIGKPDLKYIEFPYADAEKAFIGFGFSPSVAGAFIEFQKSMNEGLIVEKNIRNADTTTPTTLEEFSKIFAALYNQN
jgi:uncharacterized protein YbjT (DUF2867 family)